MRFMIRLSLLLLLLHAKPALINADSPMLPDLAMAPIRDIQILNSSDGRRLLRFTAEIINIGSGPFELHGQRTALDEPLMTMVRQRMYNESGTWQDVLTSASMHFAGDGHNHWHVNNLERYELIPIDHPQMAGIGAKSGFCFFDNHRLLGTLTPMTYPGCGATNDLNVQMGLSVGWGDVYFWNLPDQYIDISTLPTGRYWLTASADPSNWFIEQDESNNTIAIEIAISAQQVITRPWHVYVAQIMAP